MRSTKIQPSVSQNVKDEWFINASEVKLRIQVGQPKAQSFNGKNIERGIFLIHGVGGSSSVWESQIDYLTEKGYYVIAPDLIGHGRSDAPDDSSLYGFLKICQDMLDIFDQYHKDINCVVGHSYGTSFAVYLACTRPTRVQKLVLMSGGAPVPLAAHLGLLSLPITLLACLKPTLTRMFYRNAFHRKSRQIPNKDAAFDAPLHVIRHTMSGQIWAEGDEEFHRLISQPTLLLHGEDDKLEDSGNTAVMHEVLPHSEFLVIPNSSHMIMMEQAELVNHQVYKFIKLEHAAIRKEETTPVSSPRRTPLPDRRHRARDQHSMTKSQPMLR